MRILGISEGANSSVCLLENGKVIIALQEERFLKIKEYIGFPHKTLSYILSKYKLQATDIDVVQLSNYYDVTFTMAEFHANYNRQFDNRLSYRTNQWLRKMMRRTLPSKMFKFLQKQVRHFETAEQSLSQYGFDEKKIQRMHHQLTHASAAYYGRRLNNEPHIVISLDGGGDGDCAHVYRGENGRLTLLGATPYGQSPGNIYSCVTHFMGMKPHEHEYKLMGISAYAKEEYCRDIADKLHQYLDVDETNSFCFKRKIPEPTSRIGARLYREFKRVRFDNMAGGLQLFTEEILLKWVAGIVKQTGIKKVVLGGGVFMNIKANQRIAGELDLEYFDVMPSCGDESNCFGAAWHYYAHHSDTRGEDIEFNTYCLGNEGSECLDEAKKKYANILAFTEVASASETTAKLLADGHIVARCSGAMEFGARALGNRSILADAENTKAVPIINKMIKNRDFWMPFAPAMKKEKVKDYINVPKCLPDTISPFMMHAFATTDNRHEFFAGVHAYDLTARAQVVTPESNAGFYEVISEFEKLTGKGVVLNTSFNLHGYPIVQTALDACDVMVKSGLEYLMIDDYLITKKFIKKSKDDKPA